MDEYIRDVGEMKYQQGRLDQKMETVLRMHRHHYDPQFISRCAGVDPETVEKWIKETDREN